MRLSPKLLVKLFLTLFVVYLLYLICHLREQDLKYQLSLSAHQQSEFVYPHYPDNKGVDNVKDSTQKKPAATQIIYPSKNNTLDDRIVSQIQFVPDSVKSPHGHPRPVKNKLLLYYDSLLPHPTGAQYFLEHACAVKACELSADVNRMPEADVVLFSYAGGLAESLRTRDPWQIWAVFLLESPEHTPSLQSLSNQVNWTATYRHDSTLVTPYEKYVPLNASRPTQPPVRNFAAGKNRLVAWFVSNCFTPNHRRSYVEELSQHIQVDTYGACGELQCPRSQSEKCSQMLNAHYKFYLAFENSNCREYITEKFFITGLQHDVIPVVMGAAPEDYQRLAPPHSFLHVDDFSSPAQLAAYLHRLNEDDALYNSYFQWKGLWKTIDTLFPCRLCALAHDVDNRQDTWYADVDSWWNGPGICIGDRTWKSLLTEDRKDVVVDEPPEDEY